MPLGTSSRSIRDLITARTSVRYAFALGAAACATVALGAAGAHAQAPGDRLQVARQDATAAAAQLLPINASVLPINANVPVCASLVGGCANNGNSANQATDQGNDATAVAANRSKQSSGHGRRNPQVASQGALAGAAQVLPVNASALPVNANVPVCASLLGSCANSGNEANQLVGQNNSAQAIAANRSHQRGSTGGDRDHRDCGCRGGDPGGDRGRRASVQVAHQQAAAGAAQLLPVNASALPINADVPVCLSVTGCANTGNSANQATVQRNSATAAALNASGQRQGGGDDPADPTQVARQGALAGAAQVLPINASALPVNANVPVCLAGSSCANAANSANQLTAQGNSAGALAANRSHQHQHS
jgi:hypothetical protein